MFFYLLPRLVHVHFVRLMMCRILPAECLWVVAMTDTAKMVENMDEGRSRAVDD